MPRILHFTKSPEDWKSIFAKPDLHWKTGRSARTLAHSWEAANGIPPEIAQAFAASDDPHVRDLTPILAVPEFKVSLPGGERASQNDVFVLAKSNAGPVIIMVEGKVDESFGPTMGEWELEASPGKDTRREFLIRTLGLAKPLPPGIRYQLLHRTASALIVADQYRASAAVMIVHSFSGKRSGWDDYTAFLRLYNVESVAGRLQRLSAAPVPLLVAWIPGDLAYLRC